MISDQFPAPRCTHYVLQENQIGGYAHTGEWINCLLYYQQCSPSTYICLPVGMSEYLKHILSKKSLTDHLPFISLAVSFVSMFCIISVTPSCARSGGGVMGLVSTEFICSVKKLIFLLKLNQSTFGGKKNVYFPQKKTAKKKLKLFSL